MCCIKKKYYQYLQREHSDKFACKSWELTDFCAEPVANAFSEFSFLRQKWWIHLQYALYCLLLKFSSTKTKACLILFVLDGEINCD